MVKILSVIVSIGEVFAIKYLVDALTAWNLVETSDILLLLIILAVIMYVNGFLGMMTGLSLSHLYEREIYAKEKSVLDKSLTLKMADIESPQILDLRHRANAYAPGKTFTNGIDLITNMLLLIVLFLIVTIHGHWGLTLALIMVFMLQMFAQTKSAESLQKLQVDQTSSNRFTDYLFNILTDRVSAKEIRLFGSGGYLKDRWSQMLKRIHLKVLQQTKRGEWIELAPNLFITASAGTIMLFIVIVVKFRGLGIADFTMLIQVSSMLIGTLSTSAKLAGVIKPESMKYNDFRKYLSLASEKIEKKNTLGFRSDISLHAQDLSFQYPDSEHYALHHITFSAKSSQHVAIVGENGSGKTTLIKLLLGYYEPVFGSIKWRCNGREMPIGNIREETSAVFQDYIKLHTTVRENIALSNIDTLSDNHKLHLAAEAANANATFPDMDEALGATFGNREPSGGQWQKLANARAYLRNGICVIYDEPTAALDAKSELETFETFKYIARNKLSFFVTHRLGAVQYADWILVLKEGRLLEQGTHRDLLAHGGEYNRLYTLQKGWYTE